MHCTCIKLPLATTKKKIGLNLKKKSTEKSQNIIHVYPNLVQKNRLFQRFFSISFKVYIYFKIIS